MNRNLILLIIFIPIISFSQSIKNWNEKTYDALNTIKPDLTKEQFNYFKSIILNRQKYQTQKRIDSTKGVIKIAEGYDFIDNKFGIIEEYRFSNGKIFTYSNNLKEWGVSFDDYDNFVEASIRKHKIDTILPRKYTAVLGCLVNKRTIRKSKRIEKMAKNQGVVIENYLKIETLIDSVVDKIYISFLIPKSGAREVQISYGPFYLDVELEYWLN
ncbi:hypothetical protein [Aquimarina macrocephali]|uniref:hypothetical protein n=1 Tax=Aquimarina macrocephali TaxID=666563 RepID=UPI000466C89D|nr:hypothetical protein [Aquimarina macrocephali]